MLNTSARLLRLLSLFQAQRYWSGAELSRRLDVTGRTLRRDVDRLRSLGYPVHSTSGVEGGYQLGAGANLPPLLLDDDEAVAVALGLRTSAQGGVSGIEEASVRALLKLEQVLPPRLRQRVTALHGFVVPLERRGGPRVDANLLSTIAAACRDCECLRFKYQDRAGSPTMRAVEPHRLVHTGSRWYLVAWDSGRDDWRTFRIDRIDGKPKTSIRFKPRRPPEGDFAKFVTKSLSQAPYPIRARITLRGPLENLSKKIPPSAGVLEAIDQNSCLLQTGSWSLEGIVMHLSWLEVDFQIHEPAELIAYVRTLAARLNASTSQSESSENDVGAHLKSGK